MIPNNDRDVNVKRDGRGFVLTLSARWQATVAAKAQKQMQTIQTNSRHAAHVSLGGNPSRRARSPPAGESPPRAGSVLSKCTSNTTKTPLLLPAEVEGRGQVKGWGGWGGGKSALELVEARLADPHGLFGRRREGVPHRALGAEDVAAVSAVVLRIHRRRRRKVLRHEKVTQKFNAPPSGRRRRSHLPDSHTEAFPAGHAVLHLVVLGPLPRQALALLDLGGGKGSEGAGGYKQRNTASAWRRYGGPPKTKT